MKCLKCGTNLTKETRGSWLVVSCRRRRVLPVLPIREARREMRASLSDDLSQKELLQSLWQENGVVADASSLPKRGRVQYNRVVSAALR